MFRRNKNNDDDKTKNVIDDYTRFPVVEAYKLARTNLMFALAACDKKAFTVTSWSKSDGKSTVSSNMAITISKLGKKVLLIDADLRRPNISNMFKLDNDMGLTDVLAKFKTFDDVVKKEVIENLDVITSGVVPPNPSELLGSVAMKDLIEKQSDNYDYIIIDTPPVGVVTDAIMLKDLVAGYLFVIREGSTTHGDIDKLMQIIKIANTQVLGFVEVDCELQNGKKGKKKGYYSNYYYNNTYY